MKAITILIADDHILVRQSLVTWFNSDRRFRVVADCNSGEEAIIINQELKPDIVLLDINLPGINGFETCKLILATQGSDVKVLGLSMNAEHIYARKMIQCGAMGYVTKNSSALELFHAVIEIFNNRKYICTDIKDRLSAEMLEPVTQVTEKKLLTVREIEIVKQVRKGLTSKNIAVLFSLSVKTVEAHRYHILKKLQLRNVAALVNYTGNFY